MTLKIDDNSRSVAGGVTDDVNLTPESLRVDPTTKRLKVTATTTDLIGTQTRTVDSVTVDTTVGGTVIIAADSATRSFVVYNNGSVTVYLGPSGVSASDGLPLVAGGSFRESNINIALYGITASGDADVRVMIVEEA